MLYESVENVPAEETDPGAHERFLLQVRAEFYRGIFSFHWRRILKVLQKIVVSFTISRSFTGKYCFYVVWFYLK